MPIYEYRCRKCGRVSEYLNAAGKTELIQCPDCGSTEMDKIISTSFISMGESVPRQSHCGNKSPCCGAATPCEKRPCDR